MFQWRSVCKTPQSLTVLRASIPVAALPICPSHASVLSLSTPDHPRPCPRKGQDRAPYSRRSLHTILFFLHVFVSSPLDFVFKSCSLVFKSIHLLFTFHFNSVKTRDASSLSLERCYPPRDKNNQDFLYTKTASRART